MSNQFENVVTYYNKSFVGTTPITQTITSSATYINMTLSPDTTGTDITESANSDTINDFLNDGKFILQEVGYYLFQFVFTVSGSASNNYIIRATKNEVEIDATQVQFTTRGTNVQWEVAMCFIVDAGYNEYDQPLAQMNKGLMRSTNTIQLQCQNVGGTGNLNLENGLYNITKID